MKKLLKFIMAVLLMLIPVSIFAQTGDDTTTGFDIMSLFTNFATFGAGVLVITGVITTYILKNISTLGRSITSWVIATIVGFIGWWLQLGIFVGIEWYMVLVVVISFATGSNIIYNVDWIRSLLAMLKLAPAKTE
jgi:hypothetical protein